MNDVDLAIRLTADAADASRAFDDVGDAATRMANDVEDATRDADRAASRLDGVGDSAENLDDKAGKATGALGALSAGFELAGMEEYATGLQSAAMATDFLSGVGQSLSLVMELQVVQTAKAKAAALGHAIATKAQAAATKVSAAAQWAFNAAMSANPIGLVIAAVVALVAIFVVLYKRNERFRELVQNVMAKVSAAIDKLRPIIERIGKLIGVYLVTMWRVYSKVAITVWNAISAVVKRVVGAIVATVQSIRSRTAATWSAIKSAGSNIWEPIRRTAENIAGKVVRLVESIKTKTSNVWTGIKTAAVNAFNAITAPVQTIIDKVESLLDKIRSIKLPKVDLNPFNGRTAAGRKTDAYAGSYGSGGGDITVTINAGVGDPVAIGKAVQQVLVRHQVYLGGASA